MRPRSLTCSSVSTTTTNESGSCITEYSDTQQTPRLTCTAATDECPDLDLSLHESDIENWIKNNLPSHDRPRERVKSITSLSSSSSCDMYTNTDESNDEEQEDPRTPRPQLPIATRKAIKLVMRKLEADLGHIVFRKCQGGTSSTRQSSQGDNTPSSQQSSRSITQSGGKRKGRLDDNSPPDENEDGPNKRRRGSQATINSSDAGVMFACPFYKHDANQYRNRRTCLGPGWPTVHRMKEHLYRAHSQSIYCPRCYAMFDSDGDLSRHLRSAQCQVSAPQPIEGIDRETLKALRKRSPALRLEEDKWRDVYQLLFPEVPDEDIPSPCKSSHEFSRGYCRANKVTVYGDTSPTEASRRFRRELLRRVQQELVISAEQLPHPVEQQLLRQVAGIIRRVENDLLQSTDAYALDLPLLSDRRQSTTSTSSSNSLLLLPPPPISHQNTSAMAPQSQHLSSEPTVPPSDHAAFSAPTLWPYDSTNYYNCDVPEPSIFRQISWDNDAEQTQPDGWWEQNIDSSCYIAQSAGNGNSGSDEHEARGVHVHLGWHPDVS